MGNILEQVDVEIDVEKLIRKLPFDVDNFESAAMEQPTLYLQAGRYRAKCLLNRARVELAMDTAKASASLALRKPQDEKKPTEKAIENRVLTSSDVVTLRKKFYIAQTAEEWSRQLVEAYRQRLLVLKIVGDSRNSEISAELRAVKNRSAVDAVRREADKVRKSYEREDED